MYVTVFGGSKLEPDDSGYRDAMRLGRLLGEAGHVVLTGGYIGSMEAVSRGAAEVGAHVIGITCDEIEKWRPVRPNQWLTEERRCPTLTQRIQALIESCDAAFALHGGAGTLTEISMMWTLLLTGIIAPRPLILLGEGWQSVFSLFFEKFNDYVPQDQRSWLTFLPNVDEGIQYLTSLKL